MKSRWSSHLTDPEEAKDFREQVKASKVAIDRFRDIVISNRNSVLIEMRKSTEFNLPAWSEKQAYQLGKLAVLDEIIDLLQI